MTQGTYDIHPVIPANTGLHHIHKNEVYFLHICRLQLFNTKYVTACTLHQIFKAIMMQYSTSILKSEHYLITQVMKYLSDLCYTYPNVYFASLCNVYIKNVYILQQKHLHIIPNVLPYWPDLCTANIYQVIHSRRKHVEFGLCTHKTWMPVHRIYVWSVILINIVHRYIQIRSSHTHTHKKLPLKMATGHCICSN